MSKNCSIAPPIVGAPGQGLIYTHETWWSCVIYQDVQKSLLELGSLTFSTECLHFGTLCASNSHI